MSEEIEIECPTCGKLMLVCVEVDPPAPEIGQYSAGFGGFVLDQECECVVTDSQMYDISEDYFDGLAQASAESRISDYDDWD